MKETQKWAIESEKKNLKKIYSQPSRRTKMVEWRRSIRYKPRAARLMSPQVYMYLGLQQVVAPSEERLELVKQLLGSHVPRFVPCSRLERSEVSVSISASRYASSRRCAKRSGLAQKKNIALIFFSYIIHIYFCSWYCKHLS